MSAPTVLSCGGSDGGEDGGRDGGGGEGGSGGLGGRLGGLGGAGGRGGGGELGPSPLTAGTIKNHHMSTALPRARAGRVVRRRGRVMRVTHDLASGGEWVQPSSSSHGSTSMRATSPRPMNDRAPTDPSRPVKKSLPMRRKGEWDGRQKMSKEMGQGLARTSPDHRPPNTTSAMLAAHRQVGLRRPAIQS